MPDQQDTKGFDSHQIDYLVSHAQQFHGQSEFDKQVGWHLNKALGVHDPTMPDDWENPESDYQQGLQREKEAIANVSDFGNPPVIPGVAKAPKPLPTDGKKSLDAAFSQEWDSADSGN